MIILESKCITFDKNGASKIDINDGCVKCIWLENSETEKLDKDNGLWLTDGYNALIELENGKMMVISNSEWGSINFIEIGEIE